MSLVGIPWWLSGKETACQCRRHNSIPGRRKRQLIQYSCLGNPTVEPGGPQSTGLQRGRPDSATKTRATSFAAVYRL